LTILYFLEVLGCGARFVSLQKKFSVGLRVNWEMG
jgi:hypothetical protein